MALEHLVRIWLCWIDLKPSLPYSVCLWLCLQGERTPLPVKLLILEILNRVLLFKMCHFLFLFVFSAVHSGIVHCGHYTVNSYTAYSLAMTYSCVCYLYLPTVCSTAT